MSRNILPCPEDRHSAGTPTEIVTTTPTPAEVSAALTLIGAEQVAPGVWTAELSIGVTIRITDPGGPNTPDRLARRLVDREVARAELHATAAARLNGGTDATR